MKAVLCFGRSTRNLTSSVLLILQKVKSGDLGKVTHKQPKQDIKSPALLILTLRSSSSIKAFQNDLIQF